MTLSQCKPGDILMDSSGGRSKVIARIGDLIARSHYYRYDIFSEWRTVEELEALKWKVLENGMEVLTKKEVENILNVKVKG